MGMQKDIDWNKVREDFSVVKKYTYLNAAGMSPLSALVHRSASDVLKLMCDSPKQFAESILPQQQSARESVANLYNVDTASIVFTQSTSLGMNMLALHLKNIEPQRNRIVTLHDEFPTSTLPWAHQGFDICYVMPEEDNTYSIERILDSLEENTLAVVASYVQYNTGSKLDVHLLANTLQHRGVHFVLNGTQAAGIMPIDLKQIPVSAFLSSGNKWIMAGVGGSVMYISERLRDSYFPPFAGWLSTDPIGFNNRLGAIRKEAASLELGLTSLVPIVCIKTAVDYLLDIGVQNIESRLRLLSDYLFEQLSKLGKDIITPADPNNRAGIISIRRCNADNLVSDLKRKNIIVISRGKDLLRISPHIYNDFNDLDYLLENL